MLLSEVPVPEIYRQSADFRFFLRWFELCLSTVQNKTDNLIDLLDPLRCPSDLLWMLADTCGFKYDERVSVAVNRLITLYFPQLINYRGSEIGVMLASELNLAQFNIINYGKENPILEERLEDTSIPVNSVSVTGHPKEGYIDIVYYSEQIPIDTCIEYVRPLGMYCFTHAGVEVNARTKVSIDASLTSLNDGNVNPGPSFISHYRRSDYASMQKVDDEGQPTEKRHQPYYRNSKYEGEPTLLVNPGYRSLYSLQLSNNEHIVKALLPSLEEPEKIFSIGYDPQDINLIYTDEFIKNNPNRYYNLQVDREYEEYLTPAVWTIDSAESPVTPKPAVNPPMAMIGDSISLNEDNTQYVHRNPATGEITVTGLDPLGENN